MDQMSSRRDERFPFCDAERRVEGVVNGGLDVHRYGGEGVPGDEE